MNPYFNPGSVRLGHAASRYAPDIFAVKRIETPGNGLLVDAALGASRFNQYVPVFLQSLLATY